MNTSEKLHKTIYAMLCGDKDYTLRNLYAMAWDAVIEDNSKDARITALETEVAAERVANETNAVKVYELGKRVAELENALREIAFDNRYHGGQALEYKDIARARWENDPMKHEPEFTYTPAPFGFSIRARFYGRWVHVMTVLSEDLAIETVQLYENGVLEWTP